MNERITLEVVAPTVEEAIAQGLAQLGLTADAVSVEVLDTGGKGFFGLGKPQVRVRLTMNPPGGAETVEPEPAASEPEPQAVPVIESESGPERDSLLDLTEAVISKLLHLLNLEAQVSASYADTDREDKRNILVDVRGNDLSVLIGKRSETLGAFQYIASLIIGKEAGQFVQLTVDVEGYRNRREKQLVQMAKRVADQVAKNGRRQTLEPMPSAERRVIHIALRDHPLVRTESTGEEPYRKVTIIPKED
jgi:spoIIIJ-associated protein